MPPRPKIVEYEGRRYQVQTLISLKEVLSFVNGRDVVKEGNLYDFSRLKLGGDTGSCEYAEFENGDMLLVVVDVPTAYPDETPADPPYVVMYSYTRLNDD